jgi:hypothetical protein
MIIYRLLSHNSIARFLMILPFLRLTFLATIIRYWTLRTFLWGRFLARRTLLVQMKSTCKIHTCYVVVLDQLILLVEIHYLKPLIVIVLPRHNLLRGFCIISWKFPNKCHTLHQCPHQQRISSYSDSNRSISVVEMDCSFLHSEYTELGQTVGFQKQTGFPL